ncbi:hypothetical protein GGG17_12630 [Arsenicicoccus sp. MKL-02]|uniref:Uncharacterized protein n=1 Tax=Arsenicicoccus cauae TaxID=2663847 RepID=A0A6I3IFI2_9MICO|nr:hypothetical protein [Arsenicicoccus cauae]MTB72792.1 hypothetical protein [Arsenicicoccus cauae]
MTDETTTTETDETPDAVEPEPTPDDLSGDATEKGGDDPESFPRDYVERLRKEAADARVRAKDRDDLAERLHLALVTATGRLADPTDLPYDEAHLEDEAALTAAVDALLARKPHLASRRPAGSVGQGAMTAAEPVSLLGLMRART